MLHAGCRTEDISEDKCFGKADKSWVRAERISLMSGKAFRSSRLL
jgi:hypothetical protein